MKLKSEHSVVKIISFALLLSSVQAQQPTSSADPTLSHRTRQGWGNHAPNRPDPVVITVGDHRVTASELCSAIGSLPPPQRTGFTLHPALAKDWFGPLVAMADEAKRERLPSPNDQKLSAVDLDNALAGELIQSMARETQPSDAEVTTYYSIHKSDFEQVKARHIVISYANVFASRSSRSASEAKAKAEDIASQLKHGGDFAALAGKESDDPYTKSKGGDLGYVSHRQLEPAVDSVLWSLADGQTSAPFEGRFGYEIVQVQERRTQPLNDVRESIIGKIKADMLERKQQQIVTAAHITLDPAFAEAPLPCETPSPPFTLKDSLQGP